MECQPEVHHMTMAKSLPGMENGFGLYSSSGRRGCRENCQMDTKALTHGLAVPASLSTFSSDGAAGQSSALLGHKRRFLMIF